MGKALGVELYIKVIIKKCGTKIRTRIAIGDIVGVLISEALTQLFITATQFLGTI